MATMPQVDSFRELVDFLDGLTGRPRREQFEPLMRRLDVTCDDLADFMIFDEQHYRRNLVCEGAHYHMLVLCWRSGQRSPIHNHAQSICGLKVLTGVATETIFERSPCGLMKAVVSRDCPAGSICVSEDSDTHQVSNLQPAGVDLATLHIYAPPLTRMETYSITDGWVGEYAPQ